MVKSDELAVFLPQDFLHELVLLIVPGRKIIFHQSAGIRGIGVEAPERVVQVIVGNQLAKVRHPGKVRFIVHETAPLTDQDRRCSGLVNVEPVFVPAVFFQGFICKRSFKPRLLIDGRAVVMRGIDDLSVLLFGPEVDRIILYTAEVAAPPVEKVVSVIRAGEISVRLNVLRVDLDTLDHDEGVRVIFQDQPAGGLSHMTPVVIQFGIVPDRLLFIRLAVRLVL